MYETCVKHIYNTEEGHAWAYIRKRGEVQMKKGENIILIGMPASGKSTVGVVVAKRLGYEFVDTDLLIQKQEGKLLKEIIAERGNDGFLKIENEINSEVETNYAVIAPGGSVIYCREAMEHYGKIGTIVYLKASYETIKKRIPNPQRRGVILRDGQTLRMLYDERIKLCEKYADIIVETEDGPIEDTIGRVLKALEAGKNNTNVK